MPRSAPDLQLVSRLHALAQVVRKRCSAACPLTLQQLHVLLRVRDEKEVTMGDIADVAEVTPASATALVDRLVTDGWIVRKTDGRDKRIVRLALMPRRGAALRRAAMQSATCVAALFTTLPATDRRELSRIIGDVLVAASAQAAAKR